MQDLTVFIPRKGRLVLLVWGAGLGAVAAALLLLWYAWLGLVFLGGLGVLLLLLWWRSGLFWVGMAQDAATTQDAATAHDASSAAHVSAQVRGQVSAQGFDLPASRTALTLRRGWLFQTRVCIPHSAVYAHARFTTPLLRVAGCCLLIYYTTGHTFVLPPLRVADVDALVAMADTGEGAP